MPSAAPDRTRTHYLDHAATTPVVDAVADEVRERMRQTGNPSSAHGSGRRARRLVEEARERVAATLNAHPLDVLFTSGGTEADNLAVKGLWWARAGRRRVLSTAAEHHAVLDAVQWLGEHAGADVELLPVDDEGTVDLAALGVALRQDSDDVALLSCLWVNNEVGTVQPVAEIVRAAHEQGVPVHTDAVQAVGHVPVDFRASGVDALSLSGHKLGGPTGVGALVVRHEQAVTPLLHGGGQERGLRSGTVDAAAVTGLALAVDLAVSRRAEQAAAVGRLRDELVARVRALVPDVVLDGPPEHADDRRAPGIAHLTFPGCDGDALLMLLDAQGVECSTGSACSAGVPRASHVLLAMGRDERAARSCLRLSLGHDSTAADVEACVAALGPAVQRARAAVAAGRR